MGPYFNRKLLISFLLFIGLTVGAKWAVDVCLPNHEGSVIFSTSGSGPESICRSVVESDLKTRQIFSRRAATTGWMVASEASISDRLLSWDILHYTYVLKGFPENWLNLGQVVLVVIFLSLAFAISWEGIMKIIQTPVDYNTGHQEEQRRRLTATYKVMPSYTPEDDTDRDYSEFPDHDKPEE